MFLTQVSSSLQDDNEGSTGFVDSRSRLPEEVTGDQCVNTVQQWWFLRKGALKSAELGKKKSKRKAHVFGILHFRSCPANVQLKQWTVWWPFPWRKMLATSYAEMSLSSTTHSRRPRVFQQWHSLFWWKCPSWQFVSAVLGSSIL